MSKKIKELAVIIYADCPDIFLDAYNRLQDLVLRSCVAQPIIVYNSQQSHPFVPSSLSKKNSIHIIETKERLHQGAALNKVLPHLWASHVLIIDSSCTDYVPIVETVQNTHYPLLRPLMISIPLAKSQPSPFDTFQKRQYWPAYDLNALYFLPWGACLLESDLLFTLEGFDEELVYDELLLDLSMKAHHKEAVIFELPMIGPSFKQPQMKMRSKAALIQRYFKSKGNLLTKIRSLFGMTSHSGRKPVQVKTIHLEHDSHSDFIVH